MLLRRTPWLLGSLGLLLGCGGAPSAPATPAAQSPSVADATPTTADETGTAQPTDPADTPPRDDTSDTTKKPEPPPDPYADLTHLPDKDSGRHQLAAADVKELVTHYRPHMREMCWIPRVNEKPEGPDTARVALEVEVSPGGDVKSVRAVGGKGYEGLADCVRDHVEHWRFPRAGQSSSLMFPILFERGESKLIRVN